MVVAASTPKSKPAGTVLEEVAEKLIKKQDRELIGAKERIKEIGSKKLGKVKVRRGKKGMKPSKFGTASYMSEGSSSEEEEAQVKGLNGKEKKITNVMESEVEGSQMESAIAASVGKKPRGSLQSRVEKSQNEKKDWASKMVKEAMQDPICVSSITAAATAQASPSPYSAASSSEVPKDVSKTRPVPQMVGSEERRSEESSHSSKEREESDLEASNTLVDNFFASSLFGEGTSKLNLKTNSVT